MVHHLHYLIVLLSHNRYQIQCMTIWRRSSLELLINRLQYFKSVQLILNYHYNEQNNIDIPTVTTLKNIILYIVYCELFDLKIHVVFSDILQQCLWCWDGKLVCGHTITTSIQYNCMIPDFFQSKLSVTVTCFEKNKKYRSSQRQSIVQSI